MIWISRIAIFVLYFFVAFLYVQGEGFLEILKWSLFITLWWLSAEDAYHQRLADEKRLNRPNIQIGAICVGAGVLGLIFTILSNETRSLTANMGNLLLYALLLLYGIHKLAPNKALDEDAAQTARRARHLSR